MSEEYQQTSVTLTPRIKQYIKYVGAIELHSDNFSQALRFIILDRKERKEHNHKPTGEAGNNKLRLLLADVIGDFPASLKSNAVDAACEYLNEANEGENEL